MEKLSIKEQVKLYITMPVTMSHVDVKTYLPDFGSDEFVDEYLRQSFAMGCQKYGDLRVWWIPQVPMKAFHVPVKDIEQAKFLLKVLAEYDIFQFQNNVKGDFSNMGGLEVYEANFDDEGHDGWCEWNSFDGDSITDLLQEENNGGE